MGVVEIVVNQKAIGQLATDTIKLSLQNRRVRKFGIYAKKDGITLDFSPFHNIQTSTGKLEISTMMEDVFPQGSEPRLDEIVVGVTDTSNDAAQEVTIRVQVI